jgi:hypothetical protein
MIIGIMGFINSGKSTVGDILVEHHGFEKIAFADTLKDATAAIFGWDRELLEGETSESRKWRETVDEFWSKELDLPIYKDHVPDFTPRLALQLMGTESGRNVFGQSLWTSATLARMKRNPKQKDFVITDVRFPNEIKCVSEWGGECYRVKRGDDPEWYRTAEIQNTATRNNVNVKVGKTMENLYPDIHISEWAWIGSEYTGTIYNGGSIDDLSNLVDGVIRNYCETSE